MTASSTTTRAAFRYEPALYLYMINSAVALLVAFGLNLTATQSAAISVIATAVLSVVTAALTRPVAVGSITAAVGTGLAAAAAFGLHLSPNQTATGITALSIILALLLRQHVSPAPVLAKAA
jgi:hypothetical protein